MYQQATQQTRGQQQKPPQQQTKGPQQNEIMPFAGGNPLGLPAPQEWNMIKEMASAAVRSGFLPKGVTPEGAAIIALKSRELGLPLMVGFAHVHVINGKPGMSAELIQAQARKNLPGLVFNILETDNNKCVVEGCRPERGSKPLKITFTIEDAKRANLLSKDVWKQYPAAMIRSRAITACLRILCPDALMGVSYTPEELGLDLADTDTIETSSRPVATEGAQVEQTPPSTEQNNVVNLSQNTSTSEEDTTLKDLRKKVWALWKSAKGTEEGFKKFAKQRFNIEPGQHLTIDQLGEVEHYVSSQLNSRPPQPIDPVDEPATSQAEAAPQAEDAPWEKDVQNDDFLRT